MRLLAAIALLVACRSAPTPKPQIVERVVQMPVKVRCATAPPPALPPVPRPKVCGELVCYTPTAGLLLVENVEGMREWITLTWGLCKP